MLFREFLYSIYFFKEFLYSRYSSAIWFELYALAKKKKNGRQIIFKPNINKRSYLARKEKETILRSSRLRLMFCIWQTIVRLKVIFLSISDHFVVTPFSLVWVTFHHIFGSPEMQGLKPNTTEILIHRNKKQQKQKKRANTEMEDFQSPRIRSYKSYEGDRNLQLVDPADLKQVRGIYVVRESKHNRSPMTSDLWRKISYKDLPARPRKVSSHSTSLKGSFLFKRTNHMVYGLQQIFENIFSKKKKQIFENILLLHLQ